MDIIQSILTKNPCYQAGKKITVKGLMLHSVGCPQPNAETFVKKWNHPESGRACVHAFIDANTGKVYQTLPWNHKAWHCGGSANSTHIGIEMCEPACIKYTGGASFHCTERESAMEVVKRTYDAAVELFAFLCQEYHLNPLADGVIISHKEGHSRGSASGHGDPEHLWEGMQCQYTMNTFRQAVAAALSKIQQAPAAKVSAMPASGSNSGCIRAGDTVTLTEAAAYYDGKQMPDWVKKDRWIVKSIQGDRAVIDKNESGTSSISSPVNTACLRKEASGEMQISNRGMELVAKYEGCRLEAYQCPSGVWTIGYGHTQGVLQSDRLESEQAAKELLKQDLKKYGGYVTDCVKKGLLGFRPTQNQFDALTSFCYNCGNGNLQKLVTGRNAAEIAEKMPSYNKGGGKVLAGLTKRREEEKQLFLS